MAISLFGKRGWDGVAVLAVLLGVAVGCSSGEVETRTIVVGKRVAPPGSMEELVDGAAVIAIGRIGSVVREADEGGFDQDGQPTLGLLMPHTYFELELEEVIKDDGTVASGRPVLLRVEGSLQPQEESEGVVTVSPDGPSEMPETGQRRLFVLLKYANGSFSTEGVNRLLDIDGDVVRFASSDGRPVGFAAGQTPDEFVAELKRLVAETDSSP